MSYADIASKGPKQSDEEKVPHALPEVQHDDSAVASVDSLAESGVHVADPTGAHQPIPHPSYADQQKAAESLESAQDKAKKAANDVSSQSRDFKNAADADAQRLANETQKSVSQGASQVKKDAQSAANKTEKEVKNAASKTEKDVKSAANTAEKEVKNAGAQAEKEVKSAANEAEKGAKNLADKAGKKFEEVKKEAKPYVEKAEKKIDQAANAAGETYEQAKKDAKPYVEKGEQKAKKAEEWAEKNKGNPVVIGNAAALAILGGVLSIGAYRMHKHNTLTWNVVGAWAGVVGVFAVGDYYVSQYFFQRYPPKN